MQEGIKYLRDNFPPLRGELWYRRDQTPGAKSNKKFLDVYFLEETLPDLLELLLGGEAAGGVGLTPGQVKETTAISQLIIKSIVLSIDQSINQRINHQSISYSMDA